jgi:hypothetical protein
MKYIVRVTHVTEFETIDSDFESVARMASNYFHEGGPDNTKATIEIIPLDESHVLRVS